MSESNKCDCVEMSCKKDCTKSHTHKDFFCEKCHSTTPNQQKIEAGAKDFAERFLPVMKELAEEETIPSWEEKYKKQFGGQNWVYATEKTMWAFIHSLLSRQREEMVALGEGLKKEQTAHIGIDTITGAFDSLSYNQAITAYQEAIKSTTPISNKK